LVILMVAKQPEDLLLVGQSWSGSSARYARIRMTICLRNNAEVCGYSMSRTRPLVCRRGENESQEGSA